MNQPMKQPCLTPTVVNVAGKARIVAVGVRVIGTTIVDHSGEYVYKVKIFNPKKKKEFVVRQLHHFKGKFASVQHGREVLCNEFGKEIAEVANFSMGYFEGLHHTNRK